MELQLVIPVNSEFRPPAGELSLGAGTRGLVFVMIAVQAWRWLLLCVQRGSLFGFGAKRTPPPEIADCFGKNV